jgi:hypothetical protein
MAERALGWQGYMGRGTQIEIDTGVAADKYQQIYTSLIKKNRPNKAVKSSLRGTRGKTFVVKGRSNTGGACTGPLMPDEIFWGIGWADLLGNNNTVTGSAGAGYTHTYNEHSSPAHYPDYGATIETNKGSSNTSLMFDFIGSFLKVLTLEIPEDGEVTWSAEYTGVDEETGGTASTPSFHCGNPAESYMVDIQLGTTITSTSSFAWKSGNWSYDNGVSMIWEGNNQAPVARAYPAMANCTGSIVADLQESLTQYNYWKYDTDVAIKIIITHVELAGTSSGVYKLTINMPRVQFMGDPPELSGEEILQITYNYEALEHCTLGYTVQVEVVNSESGTYSV